MAKQLFFAGLAICMLSIGLSQVPDPALFGIQDEPGRIMFYAGTGALAGFSGIFAVISGIYLRATGDGFASPAQRRFIIIFIAIILIAIAVAISFRISTA